MENKRIMDSKTLYTVATAKGSNIIKPQSYEGAVNAAEIFNNYLKMINSFNANTEFKVVVAKEDEIKGWENCGYKF